jgi:ATP-dependent Clp endopeptidase proteolytic subunit ClpP
VKTYRLKARIRAQGETSRIDIYDDIGADSFWGGGVSAADFRQALADVKGALEVHINSAGGDVFDGIAIAEAIRDRKGPVTTVVDGLAASIASVIAQAGAKRVMAPGSMLMVHDAWGAAQGNAAELAKMASTLDQVSANLASVYAARSGRTAGEWRDAMRDETWFTADEAVNAGLADEVAGAGARLPDGLDIEQLAARAPVRIAARLRAAADDGDGGDDAPACKTCDGKGRLKHPGTGKNSMKCPGCDGTGTYDPDGDGDDDESASGDTDHDYVTSDGHAVTASISMWEVYRAAVRDAGKVDNSPWDGSKAMANGAAADDPAAFYGGICAGKKDGDPSKQSSWALPYKYHPADPPNAAGVKNALARLSQTQGLTNESQAKAALEKAMKQVNPDYEPSDRLTIDFSALGAEISKAMKGAFK